MIKNGHHHQHQGGTAAGKDAVMTPGAAACSPEKRRRRIRVWCDGWWVPYDWPCDGDATTLLLIVCIEHVWMNVTHCTNGTGLLQVAELMQDSSPLILQGYALNFKLDIVLFIFYHESFNDQRHNNCNSGLVTLVLVDIWHPLYFPSQYKLYYIITSGQIYADLCCCSSSWLRGRFLTLTVIMSHWQWQFKYLKVRDNKVDYRQCCVCIFIVQLYMYNFF